MSNHYDIDAATLSHWADKAATATMAGEGPDPALLLPAFAHSTFFQSAWLGKDEKGRPAIEFEAAAPKGYAGGDQLRRTILPVYATITRCMEMGGAKVRFTDASGTPYQLKVAVTLPGHRRAKQTNLVRIWFNAPDNYQLRERHGADYHFIVPANFVLGFGLNREGVLAAVRLRDPMLAGVLATLFAVADRWHGRELTS